MDLKSIVLKLKGDQRFEELQALWDENRQINDEHFYVCMTRPLQFDSYTQLLQEAKATRAIERVTLRHLNGDSRIKSTYRRRLNERSIDELAALAQQATQKVGNISIQVRTHTKGVAYKSTIYFAEYNDSIVSYELIAPKNHLRFFRYKLQDLPSQELVHALYLPPKQQTKPNKSTQ